MNKMVDMTTDPDVRKLLYKVAKAYYEDGLTQREIGQRWGLSRIKVSRLLQQARSEKVVQITIIPPSDPGADTERALEASYGLLEAVIVTPTQYDVDNINRALGPAAADCLVRCLNGDEVVGLSWGTTLHAVVEALPIMSWPDLTVVQVLGGLGQPEAEVHGTDLARLMAQAFGSKLRILPAPGVVKSKLVRDALLEDPQISSTLALAKRADVVILGIGIPLYGSVVAQSAILNRDEIVHFMELGAVGDIALRFFDRKGEPMQHEVNDRTIGLTLQQLQSIPRRIGVAGGEGKLDVIRGALLGKHINVLVTDDLTAARLLSEARSGTSDHKNAHVKWPCRGDWWIMTDYLLGIDYGTGGAKACIIDPEGMVLAFAFREYPFFHDHPGWSEHDAMGYWTAACEMIQQCLAEGRRGAGIDPGEIRGVAVSSALPSMVMVDKDGCPLHRAYNLMDRRATREVDWLKETVGEARIKAITANRIEDHPSIVNLLWEKRNRPDSFARIDKALTIDGFVTMKLTDRQVVNIGGAPFYGVAYNLAEAQFDEALMEEIGIPMAILPALHLCEDIIGEVTPQAAVETGLAAGTPVTAGQVDFNASCIAAGVIDEGDIMSNLGTVGNFGVIFKDIGFAYSDIGLSMINLPFTIDAHDTYMTIPSTTTGGQSIRYLRDQFSPYEIEVERVLGVSSYDLLNMQAAKVPLGSDGLIILPYLMGERTPIWDTTARGVIFGLSLNHGKGHLVRAMMEAVAYALYDSYRLIEQSGLRLNTPIILNEGGAVSTLWRQIITDVFNVPTVLVKRRTGAPFGDAILAGVATGVFADYGVAKQWAEYVDRMAPIPGHHEQYMEHFALYKSIYEHVKDDFRALARLRGQL